MCSGVVHIPTSPVDVYSVFGQLTLKRTFRFGPTKVVDIELSVEADEGDD